MMNWKKTLLRFIEVGFIGMLVLSIFYMLNTFEFIENNPEKFFGTYSGLGNWFYVIEIVMIAFFLYVIQPWTWFRKKKDNLEDG